MADYSQPTQAQRAADRAERKRGAAERLAKATGPGLVKLREDAAKAGYRLVPLAQPDSEDVVEGEVVQPYSEWTNEALSNELKARGLAHSGNKEELVTRLEEDDASHEEDGSEGDGEEQSGGDA